MKVLRTPDHRFKNLKDFPFEPNYTNIKDKSGVELRIHHLDEGPKDGPIVLLMHGQPVWSYLYRKMIPYLTKAGVRIIAPDLVGYGRSDKPSSIEDYTYQTQVDWMNTWIRQNDFKKLTFFGQDWGGLIGLRVIADNGDRFSGAVISNTGVPLSRNMDPETHRKIKEFKASKYVPTTSEFVRAFKKPGPMAFAYWQKWSLNKKNFPAGLLVAPMFEKRTRMQMKISGLFYELGLEGISPLVSDLEKAYNAPFPNSSYKMVCRAMPSQVPTLPDDAAVEAQKKAWKFFEKFDKPLLCAFADNDPVTVGMDKPFLKKCPGTKGQNHTVLKGAGHFCQETQPKEISEIIVNFMKSNGIMNGSN
ncbi:MAG: haloalkane dehalogenase [Pseudomonadota bacterium]|jgi:haloalkane dehalogenase|uniref:Haloalkane dehalogenase n=1 Tax=SAR86 cluster bacterium TaxID=2030880 RepID=A0A9Q8U1Z8_9GAMM|nr:haloalkane dehalogenase [Pseudomonadota bacterium]URQ62827.1 haloalkane dehalogenase [SAR86 cluster bacterium]|tara:strand:- start:1681 stop:2760 length:1080 start_codon:yes stop_codon:yes gene_type:complete